MEGKIAVIKGCSWCPYKAFDIAMGVVFNKEGFSSNSNEIAYCGYHKVGFDGTQTRIESALSIEIDGQVIIPDSPIDMPDNCPLPLGDDGRVH